MEGEGNLPDQEPRTQTTKKYKTMAKKTKREQQFENELYDCRTKIQNLKTLYFIIKYEKEETPPEQDDDDEIANALDAAFASIEQAIENL